MRHLRGWPTRIVCAAVLTLSGLCTAATPARVEVEAAVDEFVKSALDARRIPGVTLVIVHEGTVVLLKGYGYANLEARSRVDPRTSVFRVGSVSKPFTATAVLQLVEAGTVAPDEDVYTYLVTMR